MKFRKAISLLAAIIVILSLAASICGIFSGQGPGRHEFKSLNGETIQIYGKGVYQSDSISTASQGIAQDIVTVALCIPLLIFSLYLSRKGLLRGRLMLAGTLGYFLYTYTSYSFLAMYNPLFLIYVILMSTSLFAFILAIMSFDSEELSSSFSPKMPVKFLGGFLIFFAALIGLMWLGRIVPPLLKGSTPFGLEHYTTLVIQAMDLGFVVPTAIISGILVIKRRTFGYLLASIITIKGSSMATAVTAMIIGQILAGVKVGFAEIIVFPIINLVIIYCLILIMRNIKESKYNKRSA